jgi:preprotein translocase subunit YajC
LSSEGVTGVLWLVVLAALGYFLLIRPTRRRAQDVRALQSALAVGVDVLLTSGIFGTVTEIDDDKVRVEIADGVVVSVHRGAIGRIVRPDAADDELGVEPDEPDDAREPADLADRPEADDNDGNDDNDGTDNQARGVN